MGAALHTLLLLSCCAPAAAQDYYPTPSIDVADPPPANQTEARPALRPLGLTAAGLGGAALGIGAALGMGELTEAQCRASVFYDDEEDWCALGALIVMLPHIVLDVTLASIAGVRIARHATGERLWWVGWLGMAAGTAAQLALGWSLSRVDRQLHPALIATVHLLPVVSAFVTALIGRRLAAHRPVPHPSRVPGL